MLLVSCVQIRQLLDFNAWLAKLLGLPQDESHIQNRFAPVQIPGHLNSSKKRDDSSGQHNCLQGEV